MNLTPPACQGPVIGAGWDRSYDLQLIKLRSQGNFWEIIAKTFQCDKLAVKKYYKALLRSKDPQIEQAFSVFPHPKKKLLASVFQHSSNRKTAAYFQNISVPVRPIRLDNTLTYHELASQRTTNETVQRESKCETQKRKRPDKNDKKPQERTSKRIRCKEPQSPSGKIASTTAKARNLSPLLVSNSPQKSLTDANWPQSPQKPLPHKENPQVELIYSGQQSLTEVYNYQHLKFVYAHLNLNPPLLEQDQSLLHQDASPFKGCYALLRNLPWNTVQEPGQSSTTAVKPVSVTVTTPAAIGSPVENFLSKEEEEEITTPLEKAYSEDEFLKQFNFD